MDKELGGETTRVKGGGRGGGVDLDMEVSMVTREERDPSIRVKELESLFLSGPLTRAAAPMLVDGDGPCAFSIETLLDVLLLLYDECCNSSLRREKTVNDFLAFGKHKERTYLHFGESSLNEICGFCRRMRK